MDLALSVRELVYDALPVLCQPFAQQSDATGVLLRTPSLAGVEDRSPACCVPAHDSPFFLHVHFEGTLPHPSQYLKRREPTFLL